MLVHGVGRVGRVPEGEEVVGSGPDATHGIRSLPCPEKARNGPRAIRRAIRRKKCSANAKRSILVAIRSLPDVPGSPTLPQLPNAILFLAELQHQAVDLVPVQVRDLRRAGPSDTQRVTALIEALRQHMAASPTFLHQEDSVETEENTEHLANPAHATWLAYQGTEAVACMGQGPANPKASTIIDDAGTTSIVSAYTRSNARGAGIATALLNQVLAWARAEGYERCAVDWEPMNVLATRFWTRHFQPVSYAMVRHVDERLVRAMDREA